MKTAWGLLLISALIDFVITAGTAWLAVSGGGVPVTTAQVTTCIVGGIVSAARTIQQALKATAETSAALRGDQSTTTTTTIAKTP